MALRRIYEGLGSVHPDELVRLDGARGTTLRVTRGTLWITLENDTRDIVLAAGDSYTIDRGGLTLIEAQESGDGVRDGAPRRRSTPSRRSARQRRGSRRPTGLAAAYSPRTTWAATRPTTESARPRRSERRGGRRSTLRERDLAAGRRRP